MGVEKDRLFLLESAKWAHSLTTAFLRAEGAVGLSLVLIAIVCLTCAYCVACVTIEKDSGL